MIFSFPFNRLVVERPESEYNLSVSGLQDFSNFKKRHIYYRLMQGASVSVFWLHPEGGVSFFGMRIGFRK